MTIAEIEARFEREHVAIIHGDEILRTPISPGFRWWREPLQRMYLRSNAAIRSDLRG